MRISPEIVESFLEQYGWDFSVSGPNAWCTGWQGDRRAFPLVIELTETWLSFTVAPLLRLGPDWRSYAEVHLKVLEFNNDCKLIKLGIDEYGDLVMSFQLLLSNVDYDGFSDSLGILGYYADRVYDGVVLEAEEHDVLLNQSDVNITQ